MARCNDETFAGAVTAFNVMPFRLIYDCVVGFNEAVKKVLVTIKFQRVQNLKDS